MDQCAGSRPNPTTAILRHAGSSDFNGPGDQYDHGSHSKVSNVTVTPGLHVE